jgi:thioredoxin-like negative regulator of GroEL
MTTLQRDKNGMIPLPNHMNFEQLFRPRRPTEEGFIGGNYSKWVVVCFSAVWCGPCQRLDKKLIVDTTPDVVWYAVDIDENETSLGYAGCSGVPAFVIIKDGVFVDRMVGAGSVAHVLNWLNKNGAPIDI